MDVPELRIVLWFVVEGLNRRSIVTEAPTDNLTSVGRVTETVLKRSGTDNQGVLVTSRLSVPVNSARTGA